MYFKTYQRITVYRLSNGCKSVRILFSLMTIPSHMIRGGQANFFRSPQLANPQLFVFTKYCKTMSQNSPKSRLFKMIFGFCKNLNQIVHDVFVRRKSKYLRTCRSFKSANYKKDQVRKSQTCKLPHLRRVHKSNHFADLRFAELIFGPPTFAYDIAQTVLLRNTSLFIQSFFKLYIYAYKRVS